MDPMPQRVAKSQLRLEFLRPSIKRDWERRLRTEPPLSPLGHPDVLVFLMDETLEQLRAGMKDPGLSARSDLGSELAPLSNLCRCSLNPLVRYYVTGEQAIRAAVDSVPAAELELALHCYRRLARREIRLLCSLCRKCETTEPCPESLVTPSR